MSAIKGAGRIASAAFRSKIKTAEEAAALIPSGANVGMSGFTGSGHPKVVPGALAKRMMDYNVQGKKFQVGVWTGASTAPELDGMLAMADGMSMRLPFQSDPIARNKINAGQMDFMDVHLGLVSQPVQAGFFGKLDVAVVEVTGITEDGGLIASTAVGNNVTWLECADKVILEVNSRMPAGLEGMADILGENPLPPHRKPIPIVGPLDRIGSPYMRVDPAKVVAVVETHAKDRNSAFTPPDAASKQIAGHIIEFLEHEVKRGRLPKQLLPLQSGVGNIANAVMNGLNEGPFEGLTAYTEVLQDGMLDMLKSGKMVAASATALSLSEAGLAELEGNLDDYRKRIILRQQDISNHPEVIRRLGCIALNAMLEADQYSNVNSTHVMGTSMMNGIGGSGDFARQAFISCFMAPSTAKGGSISTIVPMVAHTDHPEHDVAVVVTEQGLADCRGLAPRARSKLIIDKCAHPDYKPLLKDYARRAWLGSAGRQTPHLLEEALGWHDRYVKTGSMKPAGSVKPAAAAASSK